MANTILLPKIGDIVRYTVSEYIDFPGGAWCDHFVDRGKLFIVTDYRNSALTYKLKDSRGRIELADGRKLTIVKGA